MADYLGSGGKPFRFIDLFAGIGGFHLALSQMGGTCVFASEIEPKAAAIYKLNHVVHGNIVGDIIPFTEPTVDDSIPVHDVLAGGFPCQPFSKSGGQKGIDDARGTLFFNILKILEARQPEYVFLENVKNLLGPRHRDTWATIKKLLRELGYWISEEPSVFSPHLLSPHLGGAPQNRERVFIVGKFVGREEASKSRSDTFSVQSKSIAGWNPSNWDFFKAVKVPQGVDEWLQPLSLERRYALGAWEDFVKLVGQRSSEIRTLPGFPIWEPYLSEEVDMDKDFPDWKSSFILKNRDFYRRNRDTIDIWRSNHSDLSRLPMSYRKFEWQAGTLGDLNDTLVQFRPSGLRIKPATYAPTLVAINQTTYIPRFGRYLTPREAAALQSFPDDFDFGDQNPSTTFKQLGNAVSVSAVKYVFQQHLQHFEELGI